MCACVSVRLCVHVYLSAEMAGVDVRTVAELQLGNGTWKLSTLAVGMATSKRDLETKCPTLITSSATMATMWATVIGVTVLRQVRSPMTVHATAPHTSYPRRSKVTSWGSEGHKAGSRRANCQTRLPLTTCTLPHGSCCDDGPLADKALITNTSTVA